MTKLQLSSILATFGTLQLKDGVCIDAGPGLAFVMPYMANGSLLAYLKNESPNLDLTYDAEIEAVK